MEHNHDDKLRAVESELSHLSPHTLPSDLIARMEKELSPWGEQEDAAFVADGVCVVDAGLNELEIHLTQMSASAMPDDMLSRMAEAMDRWQDESEKVGKVVPIQDEPRSIRRIFSGGMLSAAAAVAVLGAVAALAWPQVGSGISSGNTVASEDAPAPVVTNSGTLNSGSLVSMGEPVAHQESVIPGTLAHKVTRTQDKGVIFSSNNIPHRCIRVDYIDRIKAKDAEGREIEIKTPGVDFMLIPVETN
jgi:hypothetical protein